MLTKLFAALLTVLLLAGSIPTQTPNAKPATQKTDTPSAKKVTLQIEKPAASAAQTQVTEPTVTEPEVKELTAAQAEDIALQQAGLTRSDVTFSRTEKDIERSGMEWEIEFRHNDWEYDYTVHAETGRILEWNKEYDPQKPAAVTPPVTEPEVRELTAADARVIALKHAGLTESQVSHLKVKKDFDDGIWTFDVEFRVDRTEYEYEIHAETGKILDWDKEIDD